MCLVSKPVQKNVVIQFRVRGGPWRRSLSAGKGEATRHLPPPQLSPLLKAPSRSSRRRRGRGAGDRGGGGRGTRNFYVFETSGFSFIVFPVSGSVIGTGLSDRGQIREALAAFAEATGMPENEVGVDGRVINSTYSGRVECACPNMSACQALSEFKKSATDAPVHKNVTVSFRSQFFPGVRLRWSDLGTVCLFNNGKYILVGVKREEDACSLRDRLAAIMSKYWTTSKRETSCAWAAVLCSEAPPSASSAPACSGLRAPASGIEAAERQDRFKRKRRQLDWSLVW